MKILCKDLLSGEKDLTDIHLLCPFCKNKDLKIWSVHLENPQLHTNWYKSISKLYHLLNINNSKVFYRITSKKSKKKKIQYDIFQKIQLKIFCKLCKHQSELSISDFCFGEESLYLQWIDSKQKLNNAGKTSDVKISVKDVKQRRHIPLGLRYKILARDNHICQSCGAKASDGIQLHIDHIKPVSRGGTNDFENLQTLCRDCNLGKSNNYK